MAEPADILAFWFGDDPDLKRDAWFKGGPDFDAACRRFEPDWGRARTGALDDWLRAPKRLLAFVILTDQIPRNIFRDDARTHATDAQALAAAQRAVAAGWDAAMTKQERVFLYLPYEHAEDLAVQDESVALFRSLDDPDLAQYAVAHRDIVARFGRFPHRNVMLGRATTAAEAAFLAEHGRGF